MAAKNHQTDTPEGFLTVPGHTRLFRRDGTYYLRAKVPVRIRRLVGKTEVRVSLRTKEYREAVSRVKIESLKVDRVFSDAERKLDGKQPNPSSNVSQDEMVWWTSKFFVGLQRRDQVWRSPVGNAHFRDF